MPEKMEKTYRFRMSVEQLKYVVRVLHIHKDDTPISNPLYGEYEDLWSRACNALLKLQIPIPSAVDEDEFKAAMDLAESRAFSKRDSSEGSKPKLKETSIESSYVRALREARENTTLSAEVSVDPHSNDDADDNQN